MPCGTLSLEIERRQSVGLIGRNGSGKSTLLKVLAGILRPSQARSRSRGRISSLLELGAGFNGELTGRENVYLNASLLGLSRRRPIGLRLDRGLRRTRGVHRQPGQALLVRHVRPAGFAVAVHVDPDILLVDEVLAVGDEHSRASAWTRSPSSRDGRTILFVTHSPRPGRADLLPRVVLDHGRVVFDGDPVLRHRELRTILGTADVPVEDRGAESDREGISLGPITFADGLAGVRGSFSGGDPMASGSRCDHRSDDGARRRAGAGGRHGCRGLPDLGDGSPSSPTYLATKSDWMLTSRLPSCPPIAWPLCLR